MDSSTRVVHSGRRHPGLFTRTAGQWGRGVWWGWRSHSWICSQVHTQRTWEASRPLPLPDESAPAHDDFFAIDYAHGHRHQHRISDGNSAEPAPSWFWNSLASWSPSVRWMDCQLLRSVSTSCSSSPLTIDTTWPVFFQWPRDTRSSHASVNVHSSSREPRLGHGHRPVVSSVGVRGGTWTQNCSFASGSGEDMQSSAVHSHAQPQHARRQSDLRRADSHQRRGIEPHLGPGLGLELIWICAVAKNAGCRLLRLA